MKKENLFWISLISVAFIGGIFSGMILQQQMFFIGMVDVLEGLEGTTFNIEVDINETLMVDRFMENLNSTEEFEE